MDIPIFKEANQTVEYIKEGRIVAFPTNTSYGLAVDALQGFALQRLRNLKERPSEKTFTVFMDPSLWPQYLDLSATEKELLSRFDGQPLTLLVKPKNPLAHLAQDEKVGLRVIDHPLMKDLAAALEVPLTATSANTSGQPPCLSPEEIRRHFPQTVGTKKEIEMTKNTTYNLSLAGILDGGTLPQSKPSTIAQMEENGSFNIVRQGETAL
jgi:L-threonylcarbamoyladenylate synthase